jgi:hypothetical protein
MSKPPVSQWSTCLEPDLKGNHVLQFLNIDPFHCLPAVLPASGDPCRLLDKARFVEQNWGRFKASDASSVRPRTLCDPTRASQPGNRRLTSGVAAFCPWPRFVPGRMAVLLCLLRPLRSPLATFSGVRSHDPKDAPLGLLMDTCKLRCRLLKRVTLDFSVEVALRHQVRFSPDRQTWTRRIASTPERLPWVGSATHIRSSQ